MRKAVAFLPRECPSMLKRPVFLQIFTLVCAVTVFAALTPSMPDLPGRFGDKVQHTMAFVILTILAAPAFPALRPSMLLLGMATIGGLIELLQLIPLFHRDAELADWLVDCAAIACAAPLAILARAMLSPDNAPSSGKSPAD